jgi:hypothetical protein
MKKRSVADYLYFIRDSAFADPADKSQNVRVKKGFATAKSKPVNFEHLC